MKRHWRPHRFAPLSQLTGSELLWSVGVPQHTAAQLQASAAEGFQKGLDRGYREGHESGQRRGFEEGCAEGLQQGRRQGAEEGRREALARFEKLTVPVESIRQSLATLHAEHDMALREEVVGLVSKVARQVVRCELTLQPAQLLSLVDEALATLPSKPDTGIEVYLNGEDLERIAQLDPERTRRWNLIPDSHLEHGECRIKAGEREADAGCRQRLAACMEQVATQLLPDNESNEAPA
jgi:flagellar assembly protein FliH